MVKPERLIVRSKEKPEKGKKMPTRSGRKSPATAKKSKSRDATPNASDMEEATDKTSKRLSTTKQISTEENPKAERSKKKTSRAPSTEETPEEASKKSKKVSIEDKPEKESKKTSKSLTGENPEEGSSKNDEATKKLSVASENSSVAGSKRNSRRSSFASSSGDVAEGAMSKEKLLIGKISFDEKKLDVAPTPADDDIKEVPVESSSMKKLSLAKGTELNIDFKEMYKKFMEVSNNQDMPSSSAVASNVKHDNEELTVLCVKKNVDAKKFSILRKGGLGVLNFSSSASFKKSAAKKITPELMGEPECIDLEPVAPPSSVPNATTEPTASTPVPSSSNADAPKSTQLPAPEVENLSKFIETKLLHIVKSSLVASGEQKTNEGNLASETKDKSLKTPAPEKSKALLKNVARKGANEVINDQNLFVKTANKRVRDSTSGKVKGKKSLAKASANDVAEDSTSGKVDGEQTLPKSAAKKPIRNSTAGKVNSKKSFAKATAKEVTVDSTSEKVDGDQTVPKSAAKELVGDSTSGKESGKKPLLKATEKEVAGDLTAGKVDGDQTLSKSVAKELVGDSTSGKESGKKSLIKATEKEVASDLTAGKVHGDQTLPKSAVNSTEKETIESELKKQEAAADDSISKLISEIPSLVVNKILIANPKEPAPPQEEEITAFPIASTSTSVTLVTTKKENPAPKFQRNSVEIAAKKAKQLEAKEKAALIKSALKQLAEEEKANRKNTSRKDSSESEEVPKKRVLRARPKKKKGRKNNVGTRKLRSSVPQETITPKRERKIPSRYLVFEEVGVKRQHASSESGREDLTDSNKKVQSNSAKKRKTTEEFTGKKVKSAVTEALSAVISKNQKKETIKDKQAESLKAKQEEAAAVLLDQVQAEYAVSALYNYRQNEDGESPLKDEQEPETLVEVDTKMKSPETKGRGRRKRLKQVINKAVVHKWSQEKLSFYQNRRKRGKLVGTLAERELLRLGHVIINMDCQPSVSAAKEEEDKPKCTKDFCKMGCVCKSLEVPMREEFHCGKAECVFQCICIKAGASNCFFDSRVQDKTRNLAPEQKEFTNTVISSGSGTENLVVAERGKRERKVPTRLQSDFVTGEEFEAASGKRRHSSKLEEPLLSTTKKRLLLEHFEMNSYSDSLDRQYVVASPDFLEDRCTKFSMHPSDTNSRDSTSPGVHSVVIERDEEMTPKIVSIASIDPEEFEKAAVISQGSDGKQDLEIVGEVSTESPVSFAMVDMRQKAKQRAMQLLSQFKKSIINANGFKPTTITFNKFCIVDWVSFTQRFYKHDLYIWVENSLDTKHSIAIITETKVMPYSDYIDVNDMGILGLPQAKIFENLNLKMGSPRCPFILWCNGKYWEILGKLSNANQAKVPNKLSPEPLSISTLPVDLNMESKWFDIPATMRNTFDRLEVRDENLSINYITLSKLLTIAWRTKKAFVSKIPKVSSSHLFTAPFGLYSVPTKAKIYLGPYSKSEFPKVSLMPSGGGPPFSVSSFVVPFSCSGESPSKLRRILPKKESSSKKSPSKSSLDRSLSPDIDEMQFEGQKLEVKATFQKLEKGEMDKISKGFDKGSAPQLKSDGVDEDLDVDLLVNADHGYFTSSNEKVPTVPFIMFGKSQCQFKHPMGSQLLLFKSVLCGLKFLNHIYKDMYTGVTAWRYNFGTSANNSPQEYEDIKTSKGLKISSKEMNDMIRWKNCDFEAEKTTKNGRKLTVLETAVETSRVFKKLKQQRGETPPVKEVSESSSPEDAEDVSSEVTTNVTESEKEEGGQKKEDLTDEEFRDRYRLEIKDAFEEAEKLYPAFGEGRTSRISLLQRMINEIELLKLQSRALESEKNLSLSDKTEIFKRFSNLPKSDRKTIMLTIEQQNMKKEVGKEDDDIEIIEESKPLPPKITIRAKPLESMLKKNFPPATEQPTLTSSPNAPPTLTPTSTAPPLAPLSSGATTSVPFAIVDPITKPASLQNSKTMIRLCSPKDGIGKFVSLSTLLPRTITAGSSMHIPLQVKTLVPQKKISSVPWVKHINSIGTIGSEDIIKIRDKSSIIKPRPPPTSIWSEEPSNAVAPVEEDDMSGMPVLHPFLDGPSSSSQASASTVPSKSIVVHQIPNIKQFKEAALVLTEGSPPTYKVKKVPGAVNTSDESDVCATPKESQPE